MTSVIISLVSIALFGFLLIFSKVKLYLISKNSKYGIRELESLYKNGKLQDQELVKQIRKYINLPVFGLAQSILVIMILLIIQMIKSK